MSTINAPHQANGLKTKAERLLPRAQSRNTDDVNACVEINRMAIGILIS